jgi:phosphoribosylformimino-5-aminoimidazole carboxamide ribotide isomerase
MKLYPAIDLMGGACVRLSQGAFESKKVYNEDPKAVLAGFAAAGAQAVHLVDLDGAKDPARRQTALLRTLAGSCPLEVQAGGGVRSVADVEALLGAGVTRVVVGTAAVENPGLGQAMFERFGGSRITLALDAFVDEAGAAAVATRGWKEKSRLTVQELITAFLPVGLERVLCTDISKDGMLAGPGLTLYKRLAAEFPRLELQASGGVRSLDDLLALKAIPVHSAVVGKALYEGRLDLAQAVRAC